MLIPLILAAGMLAAPTADTVAIVDVTVVPMDRNRILEHQTVLVVDGRIARIANRAAIATGRATVIAGQGKFLFPGLVDSHTHMLFSADARQYVGSGVTTIFDLGSFDEEAVRGIRDSIRAGSLPGPTVLMAYFVDGPQTANGRRTVVTEAEARAAVTDAQKSGFEFIKAYNSLPEAAAVALLDESRRRGVPIIGHGIRSLGLQRGLALGQAAVAHAEEYFYAAVKDRTDTAQWNQAVAFTKASGAFVIPNLSAYHAIEIQWGRRSVLDSLLASPEYRTLSPLFQREWARGPYTSRTGSLDGRTEILRRFTKQLSDAGVPLLAGTDSPTIPGMPPGPSLLLDLRELSASGLNNYEVLSAATRAPGEFVARFVRGAERFGVIAEGYRADLLLLDANPVTTLEALRHPLGVMTRGRWLSRSAMDSLKARTAP